MLCVTLVGWNVFVVVPGGCCNHGHSLQGLEHSFSHLFLLGSLCFWPSVIGSPIAVRIQILAIRGMNGYLLAS